MPCSRRVRAGGWVPEGREQQLKADRHLIAEIDRLFSLGCISVRIRFAM